MNGVYFGIGIGIFLCLAGQRFIKVAVKAWKDRKADEDKKTEEKLELMANKIVGKIKKKKE